MLLARSSSLRGIGSFFSSNHNFDIQSFIKIMYLPWVTRQINQHSPKECERVVECLLRVLIALRLDMSCEALTNLIFGTAVYEEI